MILADDMQMGMLVWEKKEEEKKQFALSSLAKDAAHILEAMLYSLIDSPAINNYSFFYSCLCFEWLGAASTWCAH